MSAAQTQPPGTFLPGTKVTVGSHRVTIEKYLSEGGFAHVYVVRVPREEGKYELAVLKRVAVPDKSHLAEMRTEVETMKKLKGHRHIVTYFDSHASQLQGGGYEVFLLMEFCSGGGLIDFMNTRLQHRLTEPEILKIFGDVAEGVATMHYLQPPLLHRDLKVENVLISKAPGSGGTPLYKLCDFGSTAPPRPAAKTAEEGRLIEEDVQKHTTMQYRCPEMIDVWRKQPIDEKADIWALGVLLYKLCYYTTPFEDVGQMAILNATFKYPSYPAFSDRLKKLIAWTLKENPQARPNIFQVIKEVCSMRGTEVPIKDIYTGRPASEARRNQALPSPDPSATATIGLQKTAPQVHTQAIPDIAPMRRGRPAASSAQPAVANKPAATQGDPFAALDSKNFDVRAGAVDELSKKYPSLDEFSITHDGAKKFAFSNSSSPPGSSGGNKASLSERVTNALADEAFSRLAAANNISAQGKVTSQQQRPVSTNVTAPVKTLPVKPAKDSRHVGAAEHIPTNPAYRSTAVGTSPPLPAKPKIPEVSNRPVWRVPEKAASPRIIEPAQMSLPQRPVMGEAQRSKSQLQVSGSGQIGTAGLYPGSSSPNIDGQRQSSLQLDNTGTSRGRSADSQVRTPGLYVSSDIDYLRDQEQARKRPSMEMRRHSRQASYTRESSADDRATDTSTEQSAVAADSDLSRKSSVKKHSFGHHKRASLSALSGAKQMLTGRFNDARKLFEGNRPEQDLALITPTPGDDDDEPRLLSPIAGSEAALSRHSDRDSTVDETEDMPPEMRREMERRRLSEEERRVAAAAADYRARVLAQGTGGPAAAHGTSSRANTIQQRVQSLLDEGRQSPAPPKTASGYGHYNDAQNVTAAADETTVPASAAKPEIPSWTGPPIGAKRPISSVPQSSTSNNPYPKTRAQQISQPVPVLAAKPVTASFPPVQHVNSAPAQLSNTAQSIPQRSTSSAQRPTAPPKPTTLRPSGTVNVSTANASPQLRPQSQHHSPAPQSPELFQPQPRPPVLAPKPTGLAALLAKDLEGVPDYPPRGSSLAGDGAHSAGPVLTSTAPAKPVQPQPSQQQRIVGNAEPDDLADFSKRFPSLSGIEMVETEIGDSSNPGRREIRVKDV
jgi:AP2-associated kinase